MTDRQRTPYTFDNLVRDLGLTVRVMLAWPATLLVWGAVRTDETSIGASFAFLGELVPVEVQIMLYTVPFIVSFWPRPPLVLFYVAALPLVMYISSAFTRIILQGFSWQTYAAYNVLYAALLLWMIALLTLARRIQAVEHDA